MRQLLIAGLMLALTAPAAWAGTFTETAPRAIDETTETTFDWGFSAALNFTSGDFGGGAKSRTVYVPFTLTRYFEQGDVSCTLPFVRQDAPAGVKPIRGRSYKAQNNISSIKNNSSGIGDMLLTGRYYWLHEEDDRVNLSPVGIIKLPTADDGDNLGTGEFDATIGFESSKSLDEQWSLLFDLFYTFIGDPDGFELDNQVYFSLGGGYQLSEDTSFTLTYQQSTALTDDGDSPIAFVLRADQKVDPTTWVFGDISLGVSDGAPDFGITAGIGVYF